MNAYAVVSKETSSVWGVGASPGEAVDDALSWHDKGTILPKRCVVVSITAFEYDRAKTDLRNIEGPHLLKRPGFRLIAKNQTA